MSNPSSHGTETAINDQQVITATAFIHANFKGVEKVFLAKRADTKKFLPGIYELPGGHIHFGEDIVAGLKREIREELKKEVSIGDPFYVFTYMNYVKNVHSIEVIYFAQFSGSIEDIKLHPKDHSEYGWFDEETVTKQIASKRSNDPEIKAVLRGFQLLNDGTPNFS